MGQAYRAWFELGKLWMRVSDSYLVWSSSDSARYKHWVCSEVQCTAIGSEQYVYPVALKESKERAIAAFQNSIQINTDYADAWIELARIHHNKADYQQAISEAREATRLAPGNWLGWELLGASYYSTASYADAVDALQRGQAVAPVDKKSSMLLLLGLVYAEKGNREQVLKVYKELKATSPKDAESLFKYAVLPNKPE